MSGFTINRFLTECIIRKCHLIGEGENMPVTGEKTLFSLGLAYINSILQQLC
jgi:hypothetical protein